MPGKIVLLGSPKRTGLDDILNEGTKKGLNIALVDTSLPANEVAAQCRDTEAIIVAWPPPTMEVLKQCTKLRFIQLMSAGFDWLDVKAVHEMGVRVANSSVAIAPAVAEHTIMLMLAIYRQLIPAWRSEQHRQWDAEAKRWESHEIGGKTVGIVGLGHIGQEVARRLQGWRCNLIYYDIRTLPASLERELNIKRVPLDELLKTSDIVTVHVPLNNRTRHMISTRELSLMKPTAVLISTCRGPVVDEKALVQALKQRRIASAGLDVLEQEPTPPDNPILDLPNVVLTPHTAGGGIETTGRIIPFAIDNVRRFVSGQEPQSIILIQD